MPRTSPKDINYLRLVQQAIDLRVAGIGFEEIIEKLGHWNSISACQKAVSTALEKEFNQSVELGRYTILARNERRIVKLMNKFENNGSVIVSREIGKIDDRTAKLMGYFAPTKLAHEGKDGDPEIKSGVRVILPDLPE